jgi:hypothetical protein
MTRPQLLALAILLTLACAGVSFYLAGWPRSGIDDSDITMVYARNIATGHGYVYNIGGERVEGSTSLLWTLVCAGVFFLMGHASMWPLFAVSITLTAVTVYFSITLAGLATRARPTLGIVVACELLSAAAAFHAWSSITLMDVAMWSAACTGAAYALIARPRLANPLPVSACLVLLILTRPEGMLLAPAWVLIHGLVLRLQGLPYRVFARRIVLLFLVTFVAIATLILFRLRYFGFPFPNTYYAKVGVDHLFTVRQGFDYVRRFFLHTNVGWGVGIGLVGWALSDIRKLLSTSVLLPGPNIQVPNEKSNPLEVRFGLALVTLSGVSIRLLEGADHFAGFRCIQPFVPLGLALAAGVLSDALGTKRLASHALIILSFVTLPLGWIRFWAHSSRRYSLTQEHGLALDQRRIAHQLGLAIRVGSKPPTVALVPAGGFAWAYVGPVLDLMGLNWVEMAHDTTSRYGYVGHSSFSPKVFWKARPDIVEPILNRGVLKSACDAVHPGFNWLLGGLLTSERFRRDYAGAEIDLGNDRLRFLYRRDFDLKAVFPTAVSTEWPSHLDNWGACVAAGPWLRP